MTDRRTDGRTDGQNYDPQDRDSIAASRGKNWHTAVQILDTITVFHNLGNVAVFKLFIFTVVKNFALNINRMVPICLLILFKLHDI